MKRINESGRSMVEMLGVLAIVGVLSVGGLAGYTTAMNKYRVSEVVNAMSLTLVAAESAGKAANYKDAYGTIPSSIETILTNIEVNPTTHQLKIDPVKEGGLGCDIKKKGPCKDAVDLAKNGGSFAGYTIVVGTNQEEVPGVDKED